MDNKELILTFSDLETKTSAELLNGIKTVDQLQLSDFKFHLLTLITHKVALKANVIKFTNPILGEKIFKHRYKSI